MSRGDYREGASQADENSSSGGAKQSEESPALAGFSRSLLPNLDNYLAGFLEPLQERARASISDYVNRACNVVVPVNEKLRQQIASMGPWSFAFSMPPLDLSPLQAKFFDPAALEVFKQIFEQQAKVMEDLRESLTPLFALESLRHLGRVFLPPNLWEHAEDISVDQIREFVEQEGIPLYLVPRGETALRLLRANGRTERRKVLNDCYESLMEDCVVVLEQVRHKTLGDERDSVLDGLGAMRAGHFRSAQAMFTVTLDTLIYRFFPDRETRRIITNRKRGADVPKVIDEMGVRKSFVWLPIWNAHEEFWKHKGHKVPRHYSRHASVHGVSSRQFSKANCIQALMLVTSLIGYADQLAQELTG